MMMSVGKDVEKLEATYVAMSTYNGATTLANISAAAVQLDGTPEERGEGRAQSILTPQELPAGRALTFLDT
jgi:hypothetical protein